VEQVAPPSCASGESRTVIVIDRAMPRRTLARARDTPTREAGRPTPGRGEPSWRRGQRCRNDAQAHQIAQPESPRSRELRLRESVIGMRAGDRMILLAENHHVPGKTPSFRWPAIRLEPDPGFAPPRPGSLPLSGRGLRAAIATERETCRRALWDKATAACSRKQGVNPGIDRNAQPEPHGESVIFQDHAAGRVRKLPFPWPGSRSAEAVPGVKL
jgi:hypothetical protein